MAVTLNAGRQTYNDKGYGVELLSYALSQGYLTPYFGAGLSHSATDRFPNWTDLVRNCCLGVGIKFDDDRSKDNSYLRDAISLVEAKTRSKKQGYLETIRNHLYNEIEYSPDLIKSDLLRAVGALLMALTRNRTSPVVNFNFDDILEWYLQSHGFQPQIISTPYEIRRSADIHIFHPHGFLPKDASFQEYETRDSKDLVLTKDTFYTVYSESHLWNQTLTSILSSSICLFIGLSGDDEHVQLLTKRACNDALKRSGRSLLGYILLKESPEAINKEPVDWERGLAHLYVSDYGEIPYLLRSITELSAKRR